MSAATDSEPGSGSSPLPPRLLARGVVAAVAWGLACFAIYAGGHLLFGGATPAAIARGTAAAVVAVAAMTLLVLWMRTRPGKHPRALGLMVMAPVVAAQGAQTFAESGSPFRTAVLLVLLVVALSPLALFVLPRVLTVIDRAYTKDGAAPPPAT